LSSGESFTYWMEPNDERLYGRLQEKMGKYRDEVEKHDLHYIVAVFGLFLSALSSSEVQACIEGEEGLFKQYPGVTGLLHFQFFTEYGFEYRANPHAVRKAIHISDGSFPVKRVEA
jgi:hypothetical protein